jgi:CO/xanthine dehydrogenase FAD-binding subunit
MAVFRPTSIDEAVSVLVSHPGARIVAGGTDVMVAVQAGTLTLTDVIAVRALPELRTWVHDREHHRVRIGTAMTFAELAVAPIAGLVPALALAARALGSVQIRNAATIGGSIGTRAPNGDALVVLAALDATVELASGLGRRVVACSDLAADASDAAVRADELITAVEVPVTSGTQHFAKVTPRAAAAAVVNAAVVVDNANRSVRVALGGIAPAAVRIPNAEKWCMDEIDWTDPRIGPETARAFGRRVAAAISPVDDDHSTGTYRRHAAAVLTSRLLLRCLG